MKILLILILILTQYTTYSQVKLTDIGRIVLNTYVPEQAEYLPPQAKSLLENKLSQIASINGMGGEAINPRFVIIASLAVIYKEILPGPPVMTSMKIDATLWIVDAVDQKKFASITIPLLGVGVGNIETKAFIDAINKININNQDIKQFIETGKSKIVDYYNTQCDFIIRDANGLANRGEYDAAILKLAEVTDVCEECYAKSMDAMQMIYQQKIDKECLVTIRNAKTAWMANQNSFGAQRVAEIINSISPFSTCEPNVQNLVNEVQNKLNTDENKRWELETKKYNDAVKLQKEYQKQVYSEKKAEREAGGMRGFVNNIARLKLIFWKDNASDFINQSRNSIDYSKLNMN